MDPRAPFTLDAAATLGAALPTGRQAAHAAFGKDPLSPTYSPPDTAAGPQPDQPPEETKFDITTGPGAAATAAAAAAAAVSKVGVVVTGVAAGLPGEGREGGVFDKGNLARLLYGENCISPLGPAELDDLVDKNVVQVN